MSDVDAMVVWLREVWDADEKAAREATPGRWTADYRFVAAATRLARGYVTQVGAASTDETEMWRHEQTAAHIARHDPADTLARIQAERTLLARHELDYIERPDRMIGEADKPWCKTCGEQWPCDELTATVRALASGYRHRAGWHEGWAP